MRIVIFGGNGFIGSHLAARLAALPEHEVVLPVRNRERTKSNLILLPETHTLVYDPNTVTTVSKVMAGADAVVNLVGILNEESKNSFDRVHVEFTRMLTSAAAANKARKFIQISALGALTQAPSAYLQSKAKAEQVVRNNDSFSHVIIRPSVVFGEGDNFVNQFARLIRYFPVMPLPGADAMMQPIFVQDVVSLIIRALSTDAHDNQILHAGGPQAFSLSRIVNEIAGALNRRPKIIPLGETASYALASVMEMLPFVNIITCDNCLSMRVPSVCAKSGNDAEKILGSLVSLHSGLLMMQAAGRRSPLTRYRMWAGR